MFAAVALRIENSKLHEKFDNYQYPKVFSEIFGRYGITLLPVTGEKELAKIVELSSFLLLPGSANDTHPKYYGEEILAGKEYRNDEYLLDEKLIRAFYDAGKPILGICGGFQEINVAFGGSLHQWIDGHYNLSHQAKITPDSFFSEVYQKEEITINSYHHQAVKKIAPGFKAGAISKDGIIEAIEMDKVIAVEWHPELLDDYPFFEHFLKKFALLND